MGWGGGLHGLHLFDQPASYKVTGIDIDARFEVLTAGLWGSISCNLININNNSNNNNNKFLGKICRLITFLKTLIIVLWLIADMSLQRPGFNARPFHVGFVVDTGTGFSPSTLVFLVAIIPQNFHTRIPDSRFTGVIESWHLTVSWN